MAKLNLEKWLAMEDGIYTQQESFILKVRSIPLEDYIYEY